MRNEIIQYYVEGEDERALVDVLKNELRVIKPGKVHVFNVVEKQLPDAMVRTIKKGTTVVLIFDTDTGQIDTLERNIAKLKAYGFSSKIVLVPQVPNLEGELVHSCNIRKITELLNSRSEKEFKSDLIHITNLGSKLREHDFDINLLWNRQAKAPYQNISNEAAKIKIIDN